MLDHSTEGSGEGKDVEAVYFGMINVAAGYVRSRVLGLGLYQTEHWQDSVLQRTVRGEIFASWNHDGSGILHE